MDIQIGVKDLQARLSQVAVAREFDALKIEVLVNEVERLLAKVAELEEVEFPPVA